MPSFCPDSGDSKTCDVGCYRRRRRAFGPGHLLVVCYCVGHYRYFTVYPLGWEPFGRKPLVPLTPDGADIDFGNNAADAWSATLFQALIDAARGLRWPDIANLTLWPIDCALPVRTFRTQCRHIDGAIRLFALDAGQEGAWPLLIARLGIDLGVFKGTAGKARDGPLWRARGEKGREILRALDLPCRKILAPLIDIGKNQGYWGSPRILNH